MLVVYRTGFVRSGVLSLIAKSVGFAVCGETDEAPFGSRVISASLEKVAVLVIPIWWPERWLTGQVIDKQIEVVNE